MRQLNFGLPISIDEKNGEVRLGKDILCESAAAKNFSGIKHLAYNEGEADDNEHCYTFYQNIWTSQDAPVFQQRQMTNGITVLMPGLMGYECRKNSGHYHGLPQGHTSPMVFWMKGDPYRWNGFGPFSFTREKRSWSLPLPPTVLLT